MRDFEIISINEALGEMVVDWGWIRLNHEIPLAILENPNLTEDEVLREVAYLRPSKPEPVVVPDALKGLVKPTQGSEEVLL